MWTSSVLLQYKLRSLCANYLYVHSSYRSSALSFMCRLLKWMNMEFGKDLIWLQMKKLGLLLFLKELLIFVRIWSKQVQVNPLIRSITIRIILVPISICNTRKHGNSICVAESLNLNLASGKNTYSIRLHRHVGQEVIF